MIRFARWLLPFFILQLTACATTADLSGFSTQTTSLMNSVGEEHQAIVGKMNEVIVLTRLAKIEGWFEEPVFPSDDGSDEQDVAILASSFETARYADLRQQFIKQSNDIQNTLEAITAYSTSLAELVAAGETGAVAVQKSVGTLNGIVTTLGGPISLIGGAAVGVLSEIGDLVTRSQAQNRIEDAMAILAGPQGALRKTVGLLNLALDNLEQNFVTQTYAQLTILEQYHYGPGLISFYNNTNSWMYRNRAFYLLNMEDATRNEYLENTTEQEMYEGLRACLDDKPGCPQANLAAGLAARLVLIDDIEKDYRAYEDAKSRNTEWRNKRVAIIAQTKKALNVWADQHDAIYNSLASCGGFKALKPGCGNWSEANLRSATEKLKLSTRGNATSAEGDSS